MKEQIEEALRVIVGLPLWGAGRAAELEWFQFGARRTVSDLQGRTKLVGDYALHIQCAWRIVSPNGIVVASGDRYYPAGDPNHELPDFEWDKQGANRCDERISTFFEERMNAPLIVEAIQADTVGSLHLVLSEGYVLEVFPDDSLNEEHWRFFRPYHDEDEHFVITGQGIKS